MQEGTDKHTVKAAFIGRAFPLGKIYTLKVDPLGLTHLLGFISHPDLLLGHVDAEDSHAKLGKIKRQPATTAAEIEQPTAWYQQVIDVVFF